MEFAGLAPNLPENFELANKMIRIAAALSIFGCLINLGFIFYEGIHKKIIVKVLMALCIADLIAHATGVLTTLRITQESVCSVLSLFMTLGFVGSVLLTCCIAHSYKAYRLSESYEDWVETMRSNIYNYLIISIVGALVSAILASTGGMLKLDTTTEYCSYFSPDRSTRTLFQRYIFLILMAVFPLICTLFCLYCYFAIARVEGVKKAGRYALFFYPLILIVCYLPLGIFELKYLFWGEKNSFWLLVVAISMNLQGFLNAIAYGIFSEVYRFCCLKRGIREPLVINSMHSSMSSAELETGRKISLA